MAAKIKRLSYPWIHFFSSVIAVAHSHSGSTLPLIAVFLAAMLGMLALMLDASRVSLTANEVQTAADVVATAGLRAQFDRPRGNPLEEGRKALRINQNDNAVLAASRLLTFETGHFRESDGFDTDQTPINAVRAVIESAVPNLLVGRIGSGDSRLVTKTAVAQLRPLNSARPTLPLVIGDCLYPVGDCFDDDCMPVIEQAPSSANDTAYTSFFEGSASNVTIGHHLDARCRANGGQQPLIRVGDAVHLNGGQIDDVLDDIACMTDTYGLKTFLVPVVPCQGSYNQTKPVLGFATIVLDRVNTRGRDKGVYGHGIYAAVSGIPGHGPVYGTGTISLVQ